MPNKRADEVDEDVMQLAENRFDLLRLLFASTVFLYHLILLGMSTGQAVEGVFAELALVSVQGFFVVSGALVYGSLQRSESLGSYAEKRMRRLYPAYAVIVLVPAIYALFKTAAFFDVVRYLGANLIFLNFLEPNLPGLFQNQAYTAVNGALWTLKIEVMFYIALPVISWVLTKSGRAAVFTLLIIYIGAEAWRGYFEWLAYNPIEVSGASQKLFLQLSRQLPGQLSFFISGIVLWMFRHELQKRWFISGVAGMALIIVSYFSVFEPLRAAGLALAIASIAYAPGPKLNAARYGDISYGVYITHFPIVQALVAVGLFQLSPALGALVAALLVVGSSFVLWRVIERPMLRRDSHYRRAESGKK